MFVLAKPAGSAEAAPHLLAYVFARGLLKHQLTRIYFPDETEANAADPILSALPETDRASLVAEAHDGGLRFDIRMQGERATVFFAT
jgi:protocatechuate 3,4-dioxygenase alpha subunit